MTLEELANHYGYDFVELTGKLGYESRKGKVFGLRDRRDGTIACAYATTTQIKEYLLRIKEQNNANIQN